MPDPLNRLTSSINKQVNLSPKALCIQRKLYKLLPAIVEALLGTQEPFQSLAWLPKVFSLRPAPLAAAAQGTDDGRDVWSPSPSGQGQAGLEFTDLTGGCELTQPQYPQHSQGKKGSPQMRGQPKERGHTSSSGQTQQAPSPEHPQTATAASTPPC